MDAGEKMKNISPPFYFSQLLSASPNAGAGTSLVHLQVGGEGLELGDLALPPGERLFMTVPAWGRTLSNRGGVVSVRVNAIWRTEYRIVGRFKATPVGGP